LSKLLLDTRTLLWALLEPGRLSQTAFDLIRSSTNVVLVSAASGWELSSKHRLGRLPHAGPILAAYESHLATLRADELPVRSQHALLAGAFTVDHRDPFDRVLAAQAVVEGVPLVTDDRAFAAFPDLRTLW
jgi:PIN domain nuclease of toxin-antitoxin system